MFERKVPSDIRTSLPFIMGGITDGFTNKNMVSNCYESCPMRHFSVPVLCNFRYGSRKIEDNRALQYFVKDLLIDAG